MEIDLRVAIAACELLVEVWRKTQAHNAEHPGDLWTCEMDSTDFLAIERLIAEVEGR